MSLKKYTDEQYYAQFEGDSAPDDFDGLGGYQYVKIPELVDNFLLTYADGADSVLGNVTKHAALFHAQRAIAELSYDVARPIKSFEYELVGSLTVPMPKDYVAVTGVFTVDDNGVKHELRERRLSGNPKSPLQDENGNYLYTAEGDILYNSNSSETNQRYQDGTSKSPNAEALSEYYGLKSPYAIDDIGGFGFTGRRFGLDPETSNTNGTFLLDDVKGIISLDNKSADKLILIDYVSDGLDEDINDIKIHKFLEEAVYMYMLSKIAKGKIGVTGQDKAMFDRDYALAKRRGKHRLSKISAQELTYVFRNKAKWLKF